MRLASKLVAIGSSLAVLALTAACGGGATPIADRSPGPGALASPSSPAPVQTPGITSRQAVPTAELTPTRVYFLREEKVVAAYREVPVVSGGVAAATLRALLAGPTQAELVAGLSTTVPQGTELRGVAVSGGTARVDLSARFEAGGGSLAMSARLMQVVFTLTQFSSVQRVRFAVDGKDVRVFGGEGILLEQPATRAQYEQFLPPIFIESPAVGEPVRSPLTVRGSANVFEGAFLVEVTDAWGKQLVQAAGQASMGSWTPFRLTLTFTVREPGPGRVTGFDYSAKDGSRIDDYVVPVTLG